MAKRVLRFEIFKRDKFTCQYCGRTPPEVMLELDHIVPLSQGGSEEFSNLITSCFDCNRGKAGRPIGFTKIRGDLEQEMEALTEKERQLKEYHRLRATIRKRQDKEIKLIDQKLNEASPATQKVCLSEHGRESFRRFLTIFPVEMVLDAVDIAIARVGMANPDDTIKYTYGILHNWRRERNAP